MIDACFIGLSVCCCFVRACVHSFVSLAHIPVVFFFIMLFFLECVLLCYTKETFRHMCVPSITYWFFYSALTVNSHARQASFIPSGFWTVDIFEESEYNSSSSDIKELG